MRRFHQVRLKFDQKNKRNEYQNVMTERLKHTGERGVKLDPPSKFFTKLVNKNAIIKPEKGVLSTPHKKIGKKVSWTFSLDFQTVCIYGSSDVFQNEYLLLLLFMLQYFHHVVLKTKNANQKKS